MTCHPSTTPPDELLDARQRWQRILDAIDGLEPRLAQAIRCRYLEGMTLAAIGLLIGKSRSVVDQRLWAGTYRLRQVVLTPRERRALETWMDAA